MGIVNQIKTQQQNRGIIEQIKSGKINSIDTETRKLKEESERLNKPSTIAKETAKGTIKELAKGAVTFAKSAAYAPVDIVRGLMGKSPMKDKSSIPTIQAQTVKKTEDVFEGNKSPLRATGELTGQTLVGAADVLGATGLIRQGTKVVQKSVSKADELYKTYKAGKETVQAGKEATEIAEKISPEISPKEAKVAQTEERFYSGKPATTFKSGTPDKVAVSNKVFDATRTIQEQIPNASKMKPSDLYTAVTENISTTAKKMRPQMQATPIKPQTIDKITNDWEELKRFQIEDAPATEEINVLKRQKKFESFLQKSGNKSHADLWDTRIAYDDSIPDAVKKANTLSSESLQLQKAEWLQNRRILTEAMDVVDSPEMKALSNLYEAKNNLISKTKLNEAQVAKIKQIAKKYPKTTTAILTALGIGGLDVLRD